MCFDLHLHQFRFVSCIIVIVRMLLSVPRSRDIWRFSSDFYCSSCELLLCQNFDVTVYLCMSCLIIAILSGTIAPLQHHSTYAFEMWTTRFEIIREFQSRSLILSPQQRNTRSETMRAEDRAVTETIARSRALCLYPSLSGSGFLSHALPRSRESSLSSRRTFSISLARSG